MSLFNELKRRNVFRVGAAYVVGAWLLIQVAETIFPLFGFDDTPARIVVIVLAIGFPLFLVFSWVFEFTPEGLKRETEVDRSASTTHKAGKRLDRIIILLLALALGYFAIDKFVLEPARVAVLVEETAQQARSDTLVESYGDRSIAVLPFVDMSPNSDQGYMSDGIAEELLNLLAKISDLRVVSRSSAFAFKGKEINIPDVASQLNVAYVLEGSVRLAGNQLRITAQLIEANTDTHLWSETYDRKLENVFQIQDEISAKVVDELKIKLLGDAPRSQQIDEQAYKMALQARYFWNRRSEGDEEAALNLYQKALELSPEYAPAWAGISIAYYDRASKGKMPKEEGMALSREAAEKAYELDPGLADAQIRMGQWWGRSGDYTKQLKAYETALALEPNNSTALSIMAEQYAARGLFEKSIALYQQAEVVDPMGGLWPGALARLYITVGRFEEAENAARRMYALNRNETTFRDLLSYQYTVQGNRHKEVLNLLEDPGVTMPDEGFFAAARYLHMAVAFHALGRQEEADESAEKLEAMDNSFVEFFLVALHALNGDADKAFEWLEKADGIDRQWVEYEPYFRSITGDPRWEPALDRIGPEHEAFE